jgi:hypothetical protein
MYTRGFSYSWPNMGILGVSNPKLNCPQCDDLKALPCPRLRRLSVKPCNFAGAFGL